MISGRGRRKAVIPPPGNKTFALGLLVPLVAGPSAAGANEPGTPQRHDIELRLDPDGQRVVATDRFHHHGPGFLTFSLHPDLRPQAVRVAGEPTEVQPTRTGSTTRWRSVTPLPPGKHTVTIRYAGQPDAADPGLRITADGTALIGSAHWIPDLDSNRITYRLRIEHPPDYPVVAPGAAAKPSPEGVTVYRQEMPVTSASLLGGPYRVRTQLAATELPIATYLHADVTNQAPQLHRAAAEAVLRFSQRYGRYPHPRLAVVSSPGAEGLAFPGITYLSRRILPLPFVPERSLPHEILHNWWGNGVYRAPYSGNWTEGLTTFGADYRAAAERSSAAARTLRRQWLADYASYHDGADEQPLRSFQAPVNRTSRSLGYNKGAFLWIMLRDRIGRSAFEEGLRRFYEANVYQQASWQDLRRAFEAASGRDLMPFFGQWLDRAGAPRVRIDEVRRASEAIVLHLSQEAPAYRLRLPVVMDLTNGARIRRIIHFDQESQRFRFPLPDREIAAIRVDPNHRVFRELAPDERPPRLAGILTGRGEIGAVGLAPGTRSAEWRSAATGLAETLWGTQADIRRVGEEDTPEDWPSVILLPNDRLTAFAAQTATPQVRQPDWPQAAATRVQVVRPSATGETVALIGSDDPRSALQAIRALPHYGSYGWLAFDATGARLTKGRWPLAPGPLTWEATEAQASAP